MIVWSKKLTSALAQRRLDERNAQTIWLAWLQLFGITFIIIFIINFVTEALCVLAQTEKVQHKATTERGEQTWRACARPCRLAIPETFKFEKLSSRRRRWTSEGIGAWPVLFRGVVQTDSQTPCLLRAAAVL